MIRASFVRAQPSSSSQRCGGARALVYVRLLIRSSAQKQFQLKPIEKDLWVASRWAIVGDIDAIEDDDEKKSELEVRLESAKITALPHVWETPDPNPRFP